MSEQAELVPVEEAEQEPAPTAVPAIPDPPTPDTPVPATWQAAMRLAARIHDTEFVPKAMRGRPHTVLAAILYGEELGIGPMQALQSVHVIEGRPAASPELMRGLVQRAGHTFRIVEATAEKATVYGKRCDNGEELTVQWTMAHARAAGLAGKTNWKTYPEDMLVARATSRLCRRIFADCVKGLSYVPEEVEAIETTDRETRRLQRRLGALCGKYGAKGDAARLALTSELAGRPVESWNDLTVAEAEQVCDALADRIAKGQA